MAHDTETGAQEPATHEAARDAYLERIERHFGLRRGGPFFLSPRDWKLVQDWRQRGLPVEVVLQGINRAFDVFAATRPRHRQINSLSYCRQQIEDAWERHRERLAAEGMGRTEGALAPAARHLRDVAAHCRAAVTQVPEQADAFRQAADRLDQLAAQADAEQLGVREIDAAASELEQTIRPLLEGQVLRLPRFSPWA